MNIVIRPIEPADNPALAALIRSTLEEFAVAHPETVYFDPATDALYEFSNATKRRTTSCSFAAWHFIVVGSVSVLLSLLATLVTAWIATKGKSSTALRFR